MPQANPLSAWKPNSRWENLKFEGIPESFETSAQQSAQAEDTRKVLVNFFEDALGIRDAKGIEFQRVHKMGKPRSGSGNGSCTIIHLFLRYSDRPERVCKCGRKLRDTYFKRHSKGVARTKEIETNGQIEKSQERR